MSYPPAAPLIAVLVASLLGTVPDVLTAQNWDSVQVRSERVAEGVWVLHGAGGNIGVSAGADGVFLVDDQYAPVTAKVRAAVAAINSRPIRFVLNTHWHDDHTGGNENLGGAGALIVAHHNVRRRMSTGQFFEEFNERVPPARAGALPVVTFGSDVSFHINGGELQAFHVDSAHTDGDAIVHFRGANVIHMGDTFFNGFYPFIDTGSGGTIDGIIAAADRVLRIADDRTRIIPGHGAVTDRAGLRSYRDMLSAVRESVRKLIADGKTRDQAIAAKPTAPFDAQWGHSTFMSPDAFVRIVFSDLKKRPQ